MTTSTTVRHPPVKAKSLTLLELCQTINELQQTSSRSTAQILTRRLYLHPLSISPNAKQHTSKIIANNLLQLEEPIQTKTPSPRNPPYRGLSILSSSFPLIARTNGKSNASSLNTDTESDESTGTLGINAMSLPVLPRNTTALSSSSRKTTSTRSSFIAIQRKSKSTPPLPAPEKIDVWRHLAETLQRPPPRDPPTTPLDIHPDLHVSYYPPIRIPTCESPIEEND